MKRRLLIIDFLMLISAPLLSAGLVVLENKIGILSSYMTLADVVRYSFAPITWISVVGNKFVFLSIPLLMMLGVLGLSAYKEWEKINYTFAGVFTVYWLVLVHLCRWGAAVAAGP